MHQSISDILECMKDSWAEIDCEHENMAESIRTRAIVGRHISHRGGEKIHQHKEQNICVEALEMPWRHKGLLIGKWISHWARHRRHSRAGDSASIVALNVSHRKLFTTISAESKVEANWNYVKEVIRDWQWKYGRLWCETILKVWSHDNLCSAHHLSECELIWALKMMKYASRKPVCMLNVEERLSCPKKSQKPKLLERRNKAHCKKFVLKR